MAYNTTGNYYPDKRRSVTNPNDYIVFADPLVEQLLLENGVGDGSGITYNQAAALTSFPQRTVTTTNAVSYVPLFYNTKITSFDEFQFFTGITEVVSDFVLCQQLRTIVFPAGLQTLGIRIFEGCNPDYMFITNSVEEIHSDAFNTIFYQIYEDGGPLSFHIDYNSRGEEEPASFGNGICTYYGRGEITIEGGSSTNTVNINTSKLLVGANATNIGDIIYFKKNYDEYTVITFLPERLGIYPKPFVNRNNNTFYYFVKKSLLNEYKNDSNWADVRDYIYPYGPVIKTSPIHFLESGSTYTLPIEIDTPFYNHADIYRSSIEDGTYPLSAHTKPTCDEADAYYTTDGTTPTSASTSYIEPFNLTIDAYGSPRTVKATSFQENEWVYDEKTFWLKLPDPIFAPSGETYVTHRQYVTSPNADAELYYTTDGTDPTSASTLYNEYIPIDDFSLTIKVIAKLGNVYSNVVSSTYNANVKSPVITPPSKTYDWINSHTISNKINITCPESGVTIYYTLDRTTPTSASTLYTDPFFIDNVGWNELRAVAYKNGEHSEIVSTTYGVKPETYIITPVRMPNGWVYMDAIGENYSIYYTLDGTTPTSASTLYTEPFYIDTAGTYYVRAISVKEGLWSSVRKKTLTIKTTVSISPSAGTWNYESDNIIITSTDSGEAIYYTLDGTTPTSASTLYTQPFKLYANGDRIVNVKAIGCKNNNYSSVDSVFYYVLIPTPQISPSGGTYNDGVTVSISNPDYRSGATIYYALDNPSSYTVYNGHFTISDAGTHTVYSYITYNGVSSNVTSEVYTVIVPQPPHSPSITPPSSTYNDDITIEITTDENYPVYYTTDGSTPTSASTLYTEPFVIEGEGEHIVKAVALKQSVYSTVATNNYTIVYPKPEAPVLSPSAATFTTADEPIVEMSTADENSEIYYTVDGSTPTKDSARYTNPLYISSDCVISAVTYNENFKGKYSTVTTGTYTVGAIQKSAKARRVSDDSNGIYIKNITYSGSPAESRAITLPTVKVTDNEADITWGYHADNVDEDYGQYGTRCKVSDTSILIHLEFTHEGKKHILEKEIPCTCIEQDAIDKPFALDIVKGEGTVTLENHLEAHIRARVKHTSDETISVLTDLTDYTLKGESTMGTFTCTKDGGYFVYDGTLSLNYSGATHPAREIILTLSDSNGNELDTYNIPVTFAPGSIFEVRDDAIRMAVQGSKTYTDGQVSGITNQISQLEVNISGITGTVSAVTNTVSGLSADVSQLQQTASSITSTVSSISESVSGISADVSQLQQTASSLTSTVTELDGEAMKWSQIDQVSSAITLEVFNEFNQNTGIKIEDGKITMNADNTEILGNLNLRDGENGLTVFDQAGNPRINLRNTPVPAYGPDMFITQGNFVSSSTKITGTAGSSITCTGELKPIGTVQNGDTISLTGMWITADTFSGNTLTHTQLSVSYTIYAGASSSSGTAIKTGTGTANYMSWHYGNYFTINDFSFTSSMSGTMYIWVESTFTLPAGTDGGMTALNGYATSKPVALTMIGNNGFYSFSDDNNHIYTSSGGTYLHTEYDYSQSYKRVGAIALKDGYLLRYGPNDGITAGNSQGYVAFDGMCTYTSLSDLHYVTGQSPYTMTNYPANVAHTTDPVPVYYAKDTDSVIEVDYLDVEADIVYVDLKNLTKFNGRKIKVLKTISATVWLIDSETMTSEGTTKAKWTMRQIDSGPPSANDITSGCVFSNNGKRVDWEPVEVMRYYNNNAWKVIS